MFNSNQKLINLFNMTADVVIISVSYIVSLAIRFQLLNGNISINLYDASYILMSAIYGVTAVFIFYLLKMYGTYRFTSYVNEVFAILLTNGVCMLFFMAFLFITKSMDFSRGVLLIWWGLSCFLLIVKRVVFRATIGHYYQSKQIKNIAVIGNGDLAHQCIDNFRNEINRGKAVFKGYISAVEKKELGNCLGNYEHLEQIIEDNDIDELIVALESHETKFMPYIFHIADKEGIGLRLIPFYNNYLPQNAVMETLGNTKLINVRVTPLDNMMWAFVKRTIDIAGSLFGIVILSPVYVIAAIGVKLSSPGPVFFKQNRIGLNKKPFKMYKFRSMRMNTSETTGWSTKSDPRKTRFGSFLRKYSIDELPQLFNVLKGDMSLIGPRPEVPFYVRQFKEEVPLYLLRHQVRPGMTGWAQIHGLRGDTSIEDRVKYDLWYIENWSLWLDIKILWKTVFGGWKNDEIIVTKNKESV